MQSCNGGNCVILIDNIMADKIHHEYLFSCDHLLVATV